MPANAGEDTIQRLDKLRHSSGPLSVAQIRLNLQKTMQADAAVFRTQVGLLSFLSAGSRRQATQSFIPHPTLQVVCLLGCCLCCLLCGSCLK